jgi:hypothetical protein
VYRSLSPARARRALLRVLTSRGGIVRRFLGAFMLAAAVLTLAAAALTPALRAPDCIPVTPFLYLRGYRELTAGPA